MTTGDWPGGDPAAADDGSPKALAGVLGAVRGTGWSTVALELSGVRDKDAFMERCATAFALPGWFGRNWDALADCLTDLSWQQPAQGRLVVVTGWQEYARVAPGDWEIAQDVFAAAVEHWRGADTALEIVLALGPTD
ncbi:barstar family protein [Streptomyces spectabilis]|uniref:Barstar family protein n=1 Tax=Streptomyces spectabilis TaxID=68270 RepID=A0A516R436_STRST|nr:barstar family protein [Streptomyces spectabilis]QDQ10416.1 barstar family protein [Streptomyces spectabilis]